MKSPKKLLALLLAVSFGAAACGGSVNCRYCGFQAGDVIGYQTSSGMYRAQVDSSGCVTAAPDAQGECILVDTVV